ncbi:MAG: hypothetical protein ACREYE_21735 [Gammaproteobacteria bacterium]
MTAAYRTTAFTVTGIAAWYLWHGRYLDEARVMIAMAGSSPQCWCPRRRFSATCKWAP